MRIVIDTETTGLDPAGGDEILQLSIVDADTKQVLFDKLIQPKYKTEWEAAQSVNHISPEMVASCYTFEEYRDKVQQIMDQAEEIIGYNTQFDLDFLTDSPCTGIKIPSYCKIVDVMQEYSACYGKWDAKNHRYKWVKLIEAAEHFGFDWDQYPAHNSLGDVYATLFVYESMRDKMLYYLAECFYKDGTNIKCILEHLGHAKRVLYQMEQRREDVDRSQIIAVRQDGTPEIIVQHPPF